MRLIIGLVVGLLAGYVLSEAFAQRHKQAPEGAATPPPPPPTS